MWSHSTRVPRGLSLVNLRWSLTPNLNGKVPSCMLCEILTENAEVSSNVVPGWGPLANKFVSDCMSFRGGLPRFAGPERCPQKIAQFFLWNMLRYPQYSEFMQYCVTSEGSKMSVLHIHRLVIYPKWDRGVIRGVEIINWGPCMRIPPDLHCGRLTVVLISILLLASNTVL